MDTLLANAYGTSALVHQGLEKTAEAQLLEELEKVAAAEGIDLGTLSDEDIVEILSDAMGVEKTASVNEDGQIKLSEDEFLAADYKGRVIAHAIINELASVGNHMEKEASGYYDEDDVVARANAILEAAAEVQEVQEKTAGSREDVLAQLLAEKTASEGGEDALNAAALQLLDANDYDVDLIVDLLG